MSRLTLIPFILTHPPPLPSRPLPPHRCSLITFLCLLLLPLSHPLRCSLVTFLLMLWDYALVDAPTMDSCLRIYDGTPLATTTTAGGPSSHLDRKASGLGRQRARLPTAPPTALVAVLADVVVPV